MKHKIQLLTLICFITITTILSTIHYTLKGDLISALFGGSLFSIFITTPIMLTYVGNIKNNNNR